MFPGYIFFPTKCGGTGVEKQEAERKRKFDEEWAKMTPAQRRESALNAGPELLAFAEHVFKS